MPTLEANSTGAATPATPGAAAIPATDPAEQMTSGWKAAEHHKQEAAALKVERDALAAKVKVAEESKLAEAGQHKELAAIRERERDEALREVANVKRQNELRDVAHAEGIRNMSYLKLADPALPPGEAVRALKASDPTLFGVAAELKSKQPGVSTAVAGGSNSFDPAKTFSPDEIRSMSDADFRKMREHKVAVSGSQDPLARR